VLAAHRAATPRLTFSGWDDFAPAWGFACALAQERFGRQWYLNPMACRKARVPLAWVSCRLSLRSSVSPRDMNMPNAQFWEGGRLPVGPDYAPVAALARCNSVAVWKPQAAAPAFDLRLVEHNDMILADAAD
jgi:hypothetical protein